MKMINGKKKLLKSAQGFIWLFIPILFMPVEKQNTLTNFDPMKGNFQKENFFAYENILWYYGNILLMYLSIAFLYVDTNPSAIMHATYIYLVLIL